MRRPVPVQGEERIKGYSKLTSPDAEIEESYQLRKKCGGWKRFGEKRTS